MLFPVYKGTKDLRRSLDYLETRSDQSRLAFYGFSWGGYEGPITLALESRFKTAVLADGGCDPHRRLPEVDPINFAPAHKDPSAYESMGVTTL